MSASATILDLGRLSLSFGEGRRMDLDVGLEPLSLGGQEYAARTVERARVDVSRTAAGYALRLRSTAELSGPCTRCLQPATLRIELDAREVDQPGSGDDDLASPYVSGVELDVSRWAHDALALALPAKLLCRPDCAGLCPVCGVSLNDADPADHRHSSEGDPRFAKLSELKLD